MKKLTLILAIILIYTCLGCIVIGTAFAASETIYTGVLDDLKRDKNFDIADYPLRSNDHSLEVIQIAESSNRKLFVYVYQPSMNAQANATSINISMDINDKLSYTNYKLRLLNSDQTLYKYIVEGFTVMLEAQRYYDISSVYRHFNNLWDDEANTVKSNNIVEVSFPVAKLYTACTSDKKVTYTETHTEVVTITNKYCGYLRYYSGYKLYGASSCDSHYIAFSCDYDIEELYEADVYFHYAEYSSTGGNSPSDGAKVLLDEADKKVYITDKYSATNPGSGWFHQDKLWQRIEKANDFLKNEEWSKDTGMPFDSSDYQWVLRFYESEFVKSNLGLLGYGYRWTEVSDETILRLKFETNGIVYNIGVVDNKQSEPPGGQSPDNPQDDEPLDWLISFIEFMQKVGMFIRNYWWQLLLTLIGIIVVIVLAVKFGFKMILNAIWWAIRAVFKGLWWLLTLLPRAVVWLYEKIRGKSSK